ncbi:hypothetical protein, partial [Escherichia coli]|uniref:hypothetical protein n=2 Tax=Escherichia coli TaxID=562 RepID=UPI0019445EB3
RQKQKKLIMLPSETMIWQPEFTDKTLSRKIGAVQNLNQEKYANHCGEVQVCCMNSFTAEANCWHGKTKCVSG